MANTSLHLVVRILNAIALQYVNPAYEKMTGYLRSEVIGHPQTLVMNSEHEKPVSSSVLRLSIYKLKGSQLPELNPVSVV